jgi:hypothetical protein
VTSVLALAFAAGIYPLGLAIVVRYLGEPASMRRAYAYLGGAATVTFGAGTAMVVALRGSGLTKRQHPAPSAGVQLLLGVALLLVAVWMARHRAPAGKRGSGPADTGQPSGETQGPDGPGRRMPRVAGKDRRTPGIGELFLLGMITYLPSLLYVGAIKNLVDADLSTGVTIVLLVVCAVFVLQMVELPIILRLLAPRRTGMILAAYNAWMHRHGRRLVIVLAAAGGVYFLISGITMLLPSS